MRISDWCSDVCSSDLVVVPLLALLAVFGVLIVSATPVYQIPARMAQTRDWLLGRSVPETDEESTEPIRARRSRKGADEEEIDPNLGDPAYDSPVLAAREVKKRRRKKDALDVAQGLDGRGSHQNGRESWRE